MPATTEERVRSIGEPVPVREVAVRAYRVPTERPESDGTLEWDATVLLVARLRGGGAEGLGIGYADLAAATLARERLAPIAERGDALAPQRTWRDMVHAVRNLGRPGIASMAISVVDVALWDLKAKLLGLPLVTLLGAVRDEVPAYGSGGFTSMSVSELQEQLAGWTADGLRVVKMKVGRDAAADVERVRAARAAIGPRVELFVDANGAHTPKEALAQAQRFAEHGVTWFEEPVSSDDLPGLRLVRERGPAGMAVAAGEYGYDLPYFERMLSAGAVDVLQADATRCGGVTGFLAVGPLCSARGVPLSAHTAPSLHAHLACAALPAVHVEHFHDHARIEAMLFDGALSPRGGMLRPDLARPGLGLELRERDAERYAL